MESRHPIGVVSSRTGLAQDLIRAWERRYKAVTPSRGDTGRRLYSDDDLERLKLLRSCVNGGRRIGDVARLPNEELRQLIAADTPEVPAAKPVRKSDNGDTAASRLLAESLDALESLDKARLEGALKEASIEMSSPHLRNGVIVPLLETIGERWRDGSMRIAQEHLASAIVRSFLSSLRNGRHAHAKRIVITTPAGQLHELGALMAAAAADEAGWNAFYLGPNMPAEEIAAAVRELGASAVALSVIYQDGEQHVTEELRKIRSYVDDDVAVFVGGRASSNLERLISDLDIFVNRAIDGFQNQLVSIQP